MSSESYLYFVILANTGNKLSKQLKKKCHDCACNGFYEEISVDLDKCERSLVEDVCQQWFCHNSPDHVCGGLRDRHKFNIEQL